MSKKVKLDLNALKVKSFVTDLDETSQKKVKGGFIEGSWDCTWDSGCKSAEDCTPYTLPLCSSEPC
jgi:hypothetical protein